jgi:spermidine/putrescine transport system ATP-binding protein
MQTAGLECRDLTKDFAMIFSAVSHVNFDVPQGSFFSILNLAVVKPLLRMIAGFHSNQRRPLIKERCG